MSAQKYALVTTCKNEAKSIATWIADVENQTRQPDEISIVDAFSADGTWETLSGWKKSNSKVRLLQEKGPPAKGRNLAIENTTSSIIISTDMGCRLHEDWFRNICQPFEVDLSVAVVAGNYDIDISTLMSPAAWAAYYLIRPSIPKTAPGYLPSNRSVAFKKDTWKDLGGYPQDLTYAADDTVFSYQIVNSNLNVFYALDAVVYWRRHRFWRDYMKEEYSYGYGNGEAGINLPEFFKSPLYKWPEFSIFVHLLTSLRPNLFRKLLMAIRDRRYIAGLYIIPLHLATSYNDCIGFLKGHDNGET